METEKVLLFFHIFCSFIFVSFSICIFLLRFISIFQIKLEYIIFLLNLSRYLVLIILISLLFTIFFGLYLCHIESYWNEEWIHITFILISLIILIGWYAGRKDKQTRLEANSQINNDKPNELLINKLKDPFNNFLNILMLIIIVVIIALMVFKPGHD